MNDDVNAPAPVAHPADRMSSVAKLKAADLTAQGYEVAGYVLEKDDDRSAVLWDAAVRWVTPDERHRLMHVEGSLAAPAPVAQAGRSMRITGPDDDGLLWLHLTLESGQCAAFNLGTADRFAGKVAAEFSAPAPVGQGEPVAVIGSGYQLLWASGEPLADTVKRTGIKVGSVLYAHHAPVPVLAQAQQHADELMEALRSIAGMGNQAAPYMRRLAWEAVAKIEATGQEGGKDHG